MNKPTDLVDPAAFEQWLETPDPQLTPREALGRVIRDHGLTAIFDALDHELAAAGAPTLHQLHARVHALVTHGQMTLRDEGLEHLHAHERVVRMLADADTLAVEWGRMVAQHDAFRAQALGKRVA